MFWRFTDWLLGTNRHSWIYDNPASRSCIKCGKQEDFSPTYGWYEVPSMDLEISGGYRWVRQNADCIESK